MLISIFFVLSHLCIEDIVDNCRSPDQTKIKIRSNQKSGEALYLGGWLFVGTAQNSSDVTLAFEDAD